MRPSKGDKAFNAFNYLLLSLVGLATVYPFYYVLSGSFSSSDAVVAGQTMLFPQGLTFESYEAVLKEEGIWTAYANTIFYTVAGTIVNLLFTVLGAYPLSKKRLVGRTAVGIFVGFTLLFQAGMIPIYLNFSSLNLIDTRTSIIIGFAVTTWLVIILRTFFQSIPEELEEAAFMDGASDWTIMWKIYVPLSRPAIATVALFYAVQRWNSYFWPMTLLHDENKIPLQVLLKRLIVEMKPTTELLAQIDRQTVSVETIVYATIIISILPTVIAYPFIQKYFTKGLMMGSLKG